MLQNTFYEASIILISKLDQGHHKRKLQVNILDEHRYKSLQQNIRKPISTIHWKCHILHFSSVQFSHSVVSDSLRPHESQHARPPCPSPSDEVHSDSNVHRVSDAIQPSHPLSSPSPPAPNPSQHQSLFQ